VNSLKLHQLMMMLRNLAQKMTMKRPQMMKLLKKLQRMMLKGKMLVMM